jgi:hypothetical protein
MLIISVYIMPLVVDVEGLLFDVVSTVLVLEESAILRPSFSLYLCLFLSSATLLLVCALGSAAHFSGSV